MTIKVGDDRTYYKEACEILWNCNVLVHKDNTLLPMVKEHALWKLYKAYCYIIQNQIGDYTNGY
jgi:hypothetical protein